MYSDDAWSMFDLADDLCLAACIETTVSLLV